MNLNRVHSVGMIALLLEAMLQSVVIVELVRVTITLRKKQSQHGTEGKEKSD